MASFTISLSGTTSELTANIFPEIVLDDRYNYSCGLLDFTSYNSIPNIASHNNSIHFGDFDGSFDKNKLFKYELPCGSYEAKNILENVKVYVEEQGFSFDFKINENTLKTSIKSSAKFYFFSSKTSLLETLGFKKKFNKDQRESYYEGIGNQQRAWFESENVIQISSVNVLRIECNIVTGAYVNGKLCHTIHEFASNKVQVGYKIVEQPSNVIYLPVVPRRINNIQINIVDQDGNSIDLRGETVTCRIHIKREDSA